MRDDQAKRPPHGPGAQRAEQAVQGGYSPRDDGAREAGEAAQRNAEDLLKPGATPDPGVRETYGARSGETPHEEPADASTKDGGA
jgi:hypothetical protein